MLLKYLNCQSCNIFCGNNKWDLSGPKNISSYLKLLSFTLFGWSHVAVSWAHCICSTVLSQTVGGKNSFYVHRWEWWYVNCCSCVYRQAEVSTCQVQLSWLRDTLALPVSLGGHTVEGRSVCRGRSSALWSAWLCSVDGRVWLRSVMWFFCGAVPPVKHLHKVSNSATVNTLTGTYAVYRVRLHGVEGVDK